MNERPGAKSSLGRTADELKRILQQGQPLCSVCLFAHAALLRYVESLFYERVNDVGTRAELRKSGGFCRFHAQAISNHADALGSAIILEDLIKQVVRGIEKGKFVAETSSNPLLRLFDDRRNDVYTPVCVICLKEKELEELAVHTLCQALVNVDFKERFERSSGLCIPHFRLAARHHRESPGWTIVVAAEEKALRDLTRRLDELAKSYDYRSTKDLEPDAVRSWREALNITSSWLPDDSGFGAGSSVGSKSEND
jgi:hypothetical protein